MILSRVDNVILEQLEAIRQSGKANMVSLLEVLTLAQQSAFLDLWGVLATIADLPKIQRGETYMALLDKLEDYIP